MTGMTRARSKWLITSAAVGMACIAPATANAQEATPPAPVQNGVQDIIVTAQKRSENLQKVPIAVTAVSGATLSSQHITDVQGLANAIPNVQINSFSNSPDSAVFTIRGIGVNDADPYVGTTVSVVVDGVVVGVNTAALVQLFDIDRVEILRGPQGTLFGANTTGGVINVITKQPTGRFGVDGELSYGAYNKINANIAVNMPIADNLAGKISVLHTSMDGYFHNYLNDRRLGRQNMTTVRGDLKYSAGDYTATLIGEYDRARNGAQTGVIIAGPTDLFYVHGQTDQGINFMRGQSADIPDQNNRDTYAGTLTQNLKLGEGSITAITAWRNYDNDLYSDDDATTLDLLETHRTIKQHQFSQELRYAGDLSSRVKIITGAFFFDQAYTLDQQGKLDGFLKGLGQPQTQHQHDWSISGFAQGYAHLTDRLQLQAGVRYSYERVSATSTTANTFTATPGGYAAFNDPVIPGSFIAASGVKGWSNVGAKVGLDYQFDPTVLFYGYYARGFKSGGFTGRITQASDLGPFNPEHLDTFEIGAKADLLDRRLRANVALFYNLYHNMQVVQNLTNPVTGANSAAIRNAGAAYTRGAEVELTAVPVEGLTLNGSVAYLDAYYTQYNTYTLDAGGNTVAASYAGNRLMNAPRWNANIGFNWKQQVGPGKLNVTGQYNVTSSKYTNFDDLPGELVGPVHLTNASLEWAPDSAHWSIGAYGRNVFDEKYYGQKLQLTGIGILASVGAPREYGVDFKVHF